MQILRNADNSMITPEVTPIAPNPAFAPQAKVTVNGTAYPQFGSIPTPSAPPPPPSLNVDPKTGQPVPEMKVNLSGIPRAPNSSEIIAAAQEGYREPGNWASAFAQGWTKADAIQGKTDRERQDLIDKKTEEERLRGRQVEWLRKMAPEYADAVDNRVMEPGQAFSQAKSDQAAMRKGKEPQSAIGKLGYDLKNGLIDQEAYDAGMAEFKNKSNDAASPIGKLTADFKSGRIDEATYVNGLTEMAPKGTMPQKGEDGAYRFVPGQSGASFDDVSGLRKEIHQLPSYKNLSQALPIYRSMAETAGRDSKASDLNLVYGLGKIMDPTSVVREGEMVMVKNTASLPDWLQGAIASLNGGAALTPQTREAIMREAYGRVQGYDSAFQQDTSQYQGIVDRSKMNRADVIPDFGGYQEWKAPKQEGDKPATQSATPPARPRATNPETGAIVEYDGQNWVPVK